MGSRVRDLRSWEGDGAFRGPIAEPHAAGWLHHASAGFQGFREPDMK